MTTGCTTEMKAIITVAKIYLFKKEISIISRFKENNIDKL